MKTNYNYSIVIPHYNIPDLLVRCLSSIPEREDIQIIVVDDNSDGCENYLATIPELNRPHLEFYITHDKLGAGHVRNIALPHIQGKWTIFADADDFFAEEFSNILDDYIDADADLIYFNTRGVYSNDTARSCNRTKDELFTEYQVKGDINIFRYRFPEPWGKIYKTDLFMHNQIIFDETIVSNDQMFSIKCGVLAEKIMVINRPLYVVTLREGSLSHKSLDTKEKLLARFYVTARVQVFLNEHGFRKGEMLIFGHSVNMLRRFPLTFISKLPWLSQLGINVPLLLWMIIRDRVFSPKSRAHMNINNSPYK